MIKVELILSYLWLPNNSHAFKMSGQFWNAKQQKCQNAALRKALKGVETQEVNRESRFKAQSTSLEPHGARSTASIHTIGFPQGTVTQLASDRQIMALSLASTVSERPHMIGLLSVTDGLGLIMGPSLLLCTCTTKASLPPPS